MTIENNRFSEIQGMLAVDIINSGKILNEDDKNNSAIKAKNKNVNEQIFTETKEPKNTKTKRSFMLKPLQIQMLATLKYEFFIDKNIEIDLSEIVGLAIEDYFRKIKES